MRLQKFLAHAGVCSRRQAEEYIVQGEIQVNGKTIKELGTKIDPENDVVKFAGQKINFSGEKDFVYIILNKPIDYITSTTSSQGKSVLDLLVKPHYAGRNKRELRTRVYPVGRLDKDSEGLVLLTNDGDLTNKLTHPSYGHEKEYIITLEKHLSRDVQKMLEKGIEIDGEHFGGLTIKKVLQKGRNFEATVIMTQGKNRQLRKMFGQLDYDILKLKRVRISHLKLGTLSPGRWRFIQKKHII